VLPGWRRTDQNQSWAAFLRDGDVLGLLGGDGELLLVSSGLAHDGSIKGERTKVYGGGVKEKGKVRRGHTKNKQGVALM